LNYLMALAQQGRDRARTRSSSSPETSSAARDESHVVHARDALETRWSSQGVERGCGVGKVAQQPEAHRVREIAEVA